jgi:hypothetical protein
MQSFDLILFHGTSIVSDIVEMLNKHNIGKKTPNYTHVGMVIKSTLFPPSHPLYDSTNILYIFESTQSGHVLGQSHGPLPCDSTKKFLGVQLRYLKQVIYHYSKIPGQYVSWVPMNTDTRRDLMFRYSIRDDDTIQRKWLEIFNKYNKTPYELNPCLLLSIGIRCLRCLRCSKKPENHIVCSELIACVLRDLELLPPTVNIENVLPVDFLLDKQGNHTTPPKTYDSDKEIPVLYSDIGMTIRF